MSYTSRKEALVDRAVAKSFVEQARGVTVSAIGKHPVPSTKQNEQKAAPAESAAPTHQTLEV